MGTSWRVGFASLGWLLVGCAATSVKPDGPTRRLETPRAVAEAALRAAAEGRPEALAPLLDEEGRAWLRNEAGRRWLARQRAEQAERRQRLARRGPGAVRVVLRGRRAGGTPRWVSFHRDAKGRWRLLAGLRPMAGGASPRDALEGLRQAMLRLREEGLWNVLAPSLARRWRVGLVRRLEDLSALDAIRIQRRGARATALTPRGRRIEMERIDGLWYVASIGALP